MIPTIITRSPMFALAYFAAKMLLKRKGIIIP